jgi:uncharacterized FAD-dependent dehydrogenase
MEKGAVLMIYEEFNSRKGKVMVEDKKEPTKVSSMEHYDQHESDGNAATKYIIEFTGKVNCDWLRKVLDKALLKAQQKPRSLDPRKGGGEK